MTQGMLGTAETVREERLLLVQRLRRLADDDWDTPSLCAGWSVRHVLAHLVTPFRVSSAAMALSVTRHRSIGRAMDAAARRLAGEHDPQRLLDVLEENAASTFRPPGLPVAAALTDVVAHGGDIRWALGDPVADWSSPQRLAPVLAFLTGTRARAGFVPAGRLRGIRLVADDVDWCSGAGAEVHGPGLALAMAVLGRPAALPALTGDGVRLLAGRSSQAAAAQRGRSGRGAEHRGPRSA